MPSLQSRFLLALAAPVLASLFMLGGSIVLAASSGTIAQGFQADTGHGEIVAGAIVSFKAGSSGIVELATTDSSQRLAGVVDQSPLVAISSGDKKAQTVLSGTTSVLVSDLNGAVKSGDKIAASPIAGVGMLATADSQVVGTAQGSLDAKTSQSRTITDRTGRPRTVHIGLVTLQVGVAAYRAPGSDFLPPFIQNLANGVAGRPVSLLRVLLSGALLLFGFISVAMLIYTSVRSSLTSLGRNPLAAGVIRKSLYQLGAITLAVLIGALLASYLILVL
jgi:hypothetical protein